MEREGVHTLITAAYTIQKIKTVSIRFAEELDIDTLIDYDPGIDRDELYSRIWAGAIYIAEADNRFAGWLRYNLFAGNTPCLNMLYVFSQFRNQGCGTQLLRYWEQHMKNNNYDTVLILIQNKLQQPFFTNAGYKITGLLSPPIASYSGIASKQI